MAGLVRVGRAISGVVRATGRPAALPAVTAGAKPCATAAAAVLDPEAGFEFEPFQVHNMDLPDNKTVATKSQLAQYMEDMLRMRRVEIEADKLYTSQHIRGFCHLYDGQEAVMVGVDAALTREDSIITSYRNHCHQLSRGSTPREVLAELTGRYTGCQKGKGGSMHMYHRENNYFGGQGIVGAQAPLGAGLAFAQKYKENGRVAVTMFGDGAANQGQLAEAINMAALWKLPCIFLCENNRYGMGTSTDRASGSGSDFYKRGGFIPGIKIDGMDVLAVREGMKAAVQHCQQEGPIYVEVDTYRYHGHSMSDPGITYRPREEIEEIRRSKDPIDRVKSRLLTMEWTTPEEIKVIEKKVKAEINGAVKFAKTEPLPPPDELYQDVYVERVPIRGTTSFNGYSGH